LQHRFPVLEHVRDTRRCASVVLQDEELIGSGADEIHSDDVCVDTTGRFDADHLWQKGHVARNELDGKAAGTDDLSPVIDVVEKGVDCPDALLDTAFEAAPLPVGDQPRDDVERNQPLVGVIFAVHVEGDTGATKERFGLGGFAKQLTRVLVIEPFSIGREGFTHSACFVVHLIEVPRPTLHLATVAA